MIIFVCRSTKKIVLQYQLRFCLFSIVLNVIAYYLTLIILKLLITESSEHMTIFSHWRVSTVYVNFEYFEQHDEEEFHCLTYLLSVQALVQYYYLVCKSFNSFSYNCVLKWSKIKIEKLSFFQPQDIQKCVLKSVINSLLKDRRYVVSVS